jgi:small subunit ribosomal protein S17
MARTITGVVKSDKADKTIVIAVTTRKTHPIYKKQYSETTTFMAHDEKNEAKEGDKVVIIETRPISKRKRFTLKKVVETARITHVEPEAVPVVEEPVVAEKPAKKVAKPETEAKKPAKKAAAKEKV